MEDNDKNQSPVSFKDAELPSISDMVKDINDKIQVEVDRAKAVDAGMISADPLPTSEENVQPKAQSIEQPPHTILVENPQEEFQPKRRNPSKIKRENERLSRELITLAEENERLRLENLQGMQVAAKSKEDQLESNITLAQEAYRQAVELGDIDSQAEAQKYLAQYTAEKALYKREAQEELQRRYQEAQVSQRQNYEAIQSTQSLPDYEGTYYDSWLAQNSYLNPNSPNYDPGLAQEADYLAETLNRAARVNGRENEIGSAGYLNEISSYLRNKYNPQGQEVHQSYNNYDAQGYGQNDYLQTYPQRNQMQNQSQNPVAYRTTNRPTAGSSGGGYYDSNLVANNYNPNSMRLTREEEMVALKMPGNLSKEQKIELYLKEKQKLSRR